MTPDTAQAANTENNDDGVVGQLEQSNSAPTGSKAKDRFWPKAKKEDAATGPKFTDMFIKWHNLYSKFRLFLFLYIWGKNLSRPYYAHFQVTRRCNFRCPSCQVWRDESYAKGLSLDDIALLAKNLRQIGVQSVALTGGEVTLRKDILEIVEIFRQENLLIRFQTNAFLLTEGMIERLFRAGVADFYISLDSMEADIYNRINGMTRQGTFDRVLENIEHVAKISKRFGANLFLTTVLRSDNLDAVESLQAYSEKLGALIGFYGLEVGGEDDPLNIRSNEQELRGTQESRNLIAAAFKKLIDLPKSKKNNFFVSNKILNDYNQYFSDPDCNMKWSCQAGKLYLEILPEGTVAVCNATPTIPGYNFRNLPELYSDSAREDIFNKYRTTCSGCVCTRQLEDIAGNRKDLFNKVRVYLMSVFK
jgi:MoaA/NifB/PqqE/SkfB family radical SAM enzyme